MKVKGGTGLALFLPACLLGEEKERGEWERKGAGEEEGEGGATKVRQKGGKQENMKRRKIMIIPTLITMITKRMTVEAKNAMKKMRYDDRERGIRNLNIRKDMKIERII